MKKQFTKEQEKTIEDGLEAFVHSFMQLIESCVRQRCSQWFDFLEEELTKRKDKTHQCCGEKLELEAECKKLKDVLSLCLADYNGLLAIAAKNDWNRTRIDILGSIDFIEKILNKSKD